MENLQVHSMAPFIWGMLFSLIGFAYFRYGKKQFNMVALGTGIALMVYPYFLSNAWLIVGVGAALMAVPYFLRA